MPKRPGTALPNSQTAAGIGTVSTLTVYSPEVPLAPPLASVKCPLARGLEGVGERGRAGAGPDTANGKSDGVEAPMARASEMRSRLDYSR